MVEIWTTSPQDLFFLWTGCNLTVLWLVDSSRLSPDSFFFPFFNEWSPSLTHLMLCFSDFLFYYWIPCSPRSNFFTECRNSFLINTCAFNVCLSVLNFTLKVLQGPKSRKSTKESQNFQKNPEALSARCLKLPPPKESMSLWFTEISQRRRECCQQVAVVLPFSLQRNYKN